MLRGLIAPRQILAVIRACRPPQLDRRRLLAVLILAAVGLTVGLIAAGRPGPQITVQPPAATPKLAEPVPTEKPVGSSTVPAQTEASAPKSQTGGGADWSPAGQPALSGRSAPAALSRLFWPVDGRVVRGFGYGLVAAYQDYRFHAGLDLAAAVDAPVRAAADGRVKELAYDAEHRWQVVLEHGNGWETFYLELGRVEDLTVGDWVKAGQILGYLGEPGRAAETRAPHLHFEVRSAGQARNPLEFLSAPTATGVR